MKTNNLKTISPKELSATIERLHEYIINRKPLLNSIRKEIKRIKKFGKAESDSSLSDAESDLKCAKNAGRYFFERIMGSYVKLGKLLAVIKPKYTMGFVGETNRPHRAKTLPDNISKNESHLAQLLANNCDVIDEVVAKAGEEDTVPTILGTINQISKKGRIRFFR